jgi:hypothetical protein
LGDNQDSSKAAAADTWAGKEKGSPAESDEPWVQEDEEKEQTWV